MGFVIGFSLIYWNIKWIQKYIKRDLTPLKWGWIILTQVPILNLIVIGFVWYYTTITLLIKLDVLEYVEE